MNYRHHFVIGILKFLDFLVLLLAFALNTAIIVMAKHVMSLSRFFSMRAKVSNLAIFALAMLVGYAVFNLCGLYRSRRLSSIRAEIGDIVRATVLVTLGFALISWIFSVRMMTPRFLLAYWITSTVLLCTMRVALRYLARQIRTHGRNLRYALILGTNDRALEFVQTLSNHPDLGYRFLGFVDDDWPGMPEFVEAGHKVVVNFNGLAEFLRQNVVDEIISCLPLRSYYQHSAQVASLCEQHGITMRMASDIFELKSSRWRSEELGGLYGLATYTRIDDFWSRAAKRTLDIAGALGVLLLSLPVLACTAIAIKLTSPGPIFFLQERIGLNKRRFKIYKFRTMVPNAEALMAHLESQNEAGGPVFKMKKDPRITPIGRLLRKSSIDELPQLLNVLKGDMSLVGPRPLPLRDYEGFSGDWQRRRFSVKPGITCLWQVNGRSGITFEQWMRLDLQYMDEWSLWLDLKILARTIPAVLKGAGAV